MNMLLILIPVAVSLGLLGLVAFLWSLKSGQFDDLEGAANRILFDDDPVGESIPEKNNPGSTNPKEPLP